MLAEEILAAVRVGENLDWEFKSARGGLPQSMWATYSAMANTNGGVIVLGVEQRDGAFDVSGLDNPERIQANFWSSINNRNTVNLNLLTDRDVSLDVVAGRKVLTVRVPRASRRQRPLLHGAEPAGRHLPAQLRGGLPLHPGGGRPDAGRPVRGAGR